MVAVLLTSALCCTGYLSARCVRGKWDGVYRRAMGGLPAAHELMPADGLPGAACQPLPGDLPGPPAGAAPMSSIKRDRPRDESPVRSAKRKSGHSSKKSKRDKREKKEKKQKRDKKHSKDKKRIRRSDSP